MSPRRSNSKAKLAPAAVALSGAVLADVRNLILEARKQIARTVNAGLTLLYWQVGDRVRREILKEGGAQVGAPSFSPFPSIRRSMTAGG